MCWREESFFKGKEAGLMSSRIPFIMAERGGSQKSVNLSTSPSVLGASEGIFCRKAEPNLEYFHVDLNTQKC